MKKIDPTLSKVIALHRETLESIRQAETTEDIERLMNEAGTKLDGIVRETRSIRPVTARENNILDTALTAKYHLRYEAMRIRLQIEPER